MAEQPESINSQSEFFMNIVSKYGRYLYAPGEPITSQNAANPYTITVWERVDLPGLESTSYGLKSELLPQVSEAWMLRRIEPTAPLDFLEYHRRQN